MSWPPPGAELIIEGRVLGEPATAGSKSAGVRYRKNPDGSAEPVRDKAGRVITFAKDSSGEKGKSWRADVREVVAALYGAAELVDEPMALELTVVRTRKPGHFGSGRNAGVLKDSAPAYPATRPDLTKQLRAFEDALAKVVIREDSRICEMVVRKVWGDAPERAEFRLWRLPPRVGDLPEGDKSVILDGTDQASLDVGGGDEASNGSGTGPERTRAPGFPGV